ncbi:hypothetical protein CTAYLR_004502 [Chrysophaeum taylorii]|uniref:Ycf49-like protein n=1 Tax=Chrysophaeum taylorii TaxID=2483200 RepID=A0AAD7XJW9_9STRA|nr:hypothetical protein CTAYLR_004502 [Chrysophaeum taylorii]
MWLFLPCRGAFAFAPVVSRVTTPRRAVVAPSLAIASEVSSVDSVSGALFGASLFPWLGMLYFLGHPKTKAPSGVVFGLWFLLVFVFGSIPAAIASDRLFSAQLADVDWLHGAAESVLAITNCVVVFGFRDALARRRSDFSIAWPAVGLALATALWHAANSDPQHAPWIGGGSWYPSEPANALSLATWVIHTSSLVEWLVAMGLCWTYARATNVPQYKGLVWGMLPLHTSGIVACTYHLFFNSATWCVVVQALFTCIGNTTMAYAAYRLAIAQGWTPDDALDGPFFSSRQEEAPVVVVVVVPPTARPSSAGTALVGWEDLGDAWGEDTARAFLVKLGGLSVGSALLVKALPALLPFQTLIAADPVALDVATAALILGPTALNVAKWRQRSSAED